MQILLAIMMLAFTAAGLFLLVVSLRELFSKIVHRRRFERAEGVVMQVKQKVMRSTLRRRTKPTILNLPVIRFTTRTGDAVTFTSETGDTGKVSKYAAGKRVQVCYDVDREFVPMIDSWSGVWLPNLMAVLASLGFLIGAILIGFVFIGRSTN